MLFSPDFIDSICETFIDYSYSVNLFSRKFHYKLIQFVLSPFAMYSLRDHVRNAGERKKIEELDMKLW